MNSITLVNAVPAVSADLRFIPAGTLCLTAALEAAGFGVDYRDYQLCPGANCSTVGSLDTLLDNSAPVLGISCWINTLPLVLFCTERIKAREPDKVIILGGPAASAAADAILNSFPHIDAVVRGEGEETIVELMRALPTGQLERVRGISYRLGECVKHNPSRPRIAYLDALNAPAYDKIGVGQYNVASIVTARGCPFHCAFCDLATLWGHKWIGRSINQVVEEVRFLKNEYGITRFDIADDTFSLNRDRLVQFCAGLRNAKLEIAWNCYTRPDLIDEELLDQMAIAGCEGILFGVESASELVLNKIGKRIAGEQTEDMLETSAQYIRQIDASYIWGFPFETLSDFLKTVRAAARAARHPRIDVSLRQLAPTPLSRIYRQFRSSMRCPTREYLTLQTNMPMSTAWSEVISRGSPLEEMIRQSSEIFAPFYFFDGPDLEQKLDLFRKANELCAQAQARMCEDNVVQSLAERDMPTALAAIWPNWDDEHSLALLQFRTSLKTVRYSRNWKSETAKRNS